MDKAQGNPHRQALEQVVQWAQNRYEEASRQLRRDSANHDRWSATAHESAAMMFVVRAMLEIADGGGALPLAIVPSTPATDAMALLEAENADLRRLVGDYRAMVGVRPRARRA